MIVNLFSRMIYHAINRGLGEASTNEHIVCGYPQTLLAIMDYSEPIEGYGSVSVIR